MSYTSEEMKSVQEAYFRSLDLTVDGDDLIAGETWPRRLGNGRNVIAHRGLKNWSVCAIDAIHLTHPIGRGEVPMMDWYNTYAEVPDEYICVYLNSLKYVATTMVKIATQMKYAKEMEIE
jgi:hypothetical protein